LNRLRKFAASIGVTFVAFTPLLFSTPAYAQTLEEAQSALAAGRLELSNAILDKTSADEAVSLKTASLQLAQLDAIKAELDYSTLLISDPTWVHPTEEVERVRMVEKREMVSKTTLVPTTTLIAVEGITASVYDRRGYNNAPPLPGVSDSPAYTTTVPNIEFNWGSGYILQTGNNWYSEDVIVKFTGNIIFPKDGQYQFYAPADDGVKFELAGMHLIDDWYDKGGGGSITSSVDIRAGVLYPFTLYYYENGGGASVELQWLVPGSSWEVIPASAMGTQVEETTTWEEVITWEEVVTIVPETYFTTELVPGATAPLIGDPTLLAILENKQSEKNNEEKKFNEAVAAQAVAANRVLAAEAAIPVLEEAVVAATPVEPEKPVEPPVEPVEPPVVAPPLPPVVEPLPPVVEPVSPEPPKEPDITSIPLSEINPQELTKEEVTQLQEAAYETLSTAEQGSPEYEQALEQLWVAAEADDIVIDEALAAVPVLGAVATGVADAINFVGNVGADMSPAVREESKKIVVSAVVAVGAAVSSATGAATAAASSVSSRKIS
jgi:hypothetical protein